MRGVLVDDDNAIARLRHDIGLVHLRAGSPERLIEQLGCGLADLDARVGGRLAHIEGRLRRLCQA